MMKSLLLLLISIILLSCGSRLKKIEKREIKNESQISLNNTSEASSKITRKDSDFQVSDLTKTRISVIPRIDKCNESTRSDNPVNPRTMTIKDSKGNETNIPVDENSEIRFENTSALDTRLKNAELELATSEKENINLQAKNTELQKELRSSLESNKPSWWLYALIFISGVIFIPLIKYIITKRKI
ncbi:hypothetical protein IQ37_15180 [Chryseobacterium piperi]|uniref:Lipoprotein n=1 Tax=Chryseobacterium piperi TaxID=558152 RepID=A0A086AXG6_9FLAO|nr:hypothetical protein [Chryseobacterium piperi]ATL75966.1 hypothetical protein CJF12_19980 [Chryseobacterium piperi]KFF21380.1 hypothetical protein IQ37_15180 [Chryseobacterium piperi]